MVHACLVAPTRRALPLIHLSCVLTHITISPVLLPGPAACRSGIMEMAVTMVEARRRKQAAAAAASKGSGSQTATQAVPAKQEAAV